MLTCYILKFKMDDNFLDLEEPCIEPVYMGLDRVCPVNQVRMGNPERRVKNPNPNCPNSASSFTSTCHTISPVTGKSLFENFDLEKEKMLCCLERNSFDFVGIFSWEINPLSFCGLRSKAKDESGKRSGSEGEEEGSDLHNRLWEAGRG